MARRLDFLVREFVRKINTLDSKFMSGSLTMTGLQLTAAVEQMREWVRNVE